MTAHAKVGLPPPSTAIEPQTDERPPIEIESMVGDRTPKAGLSFAQTAKYLTGAVFAIIGSIFIVRFVTLVRDVMSLPYIWRCLSLILLAEVILLLGWVAMRGIRLFRALPSFDSVNDSLSPEDQRKRLEPYVNDSQLISPSEFGNVLLEKLRDQNNYGGDGIGWMADFQNFQKSQDDAAWNIVKSAAKKVAVSTATTKWAVIDMACVAYLSSLMIADLATLYNRRISSQQAFRLTVRWATDIYVSGEIDSVARELGENVGQFLADQFEGILMSVPMGITIGKIAGKGAGFFLGRLAEGTANALLVIRLGQKAIKSFHVLES